MRELQEKNSDMKTELTDLQKKDSDMKTELSALQKKDSDIKTEMSELKQRNQEQQSRIADLSHTGSWCAYQDEWTSGFTLITYDKILHADSNMNRNALNMGNGEL